MTVKQLRAFLAVARTLSFTQACEHMHLSQPALSLAIKGLEESLGGRLLVRSTRSVRLTPEGESLVPLAKRLIAEWDNTEELLRQRFTLQLGRLAVATMPSFASNLLPPALRVFRQRHPKVNVTVHDVINEQVIEMVRARQVELGLVFEPEATGSLSFAPLFRDRFVAVVPADSRLADRPSLDWATLMTRNFIALQRPPWCAGCLSRPWRDVTWCCRRPSSATSSPRWAAWFQAAWASAPCRRCASSRCRNSAPSACRWRIRSSSATSAC